MKRVTLMLAAFILFVSAVSIRPLAVQAEEAGQLNLAARSAILIEASTGKVLYEFNADNALPPASMSKMMTEYLVLEAIHNGKLNWDDVVTTSKAAADVIGSGQLLAEGEKATVKSLFEAMSIYSANDASVALAERVAGTEEDFAKLMNQKAKAMGLSEQAHFINATGLPRADMGQYAPKEIQGETLLSARDAATLAYHLIHDYKELLEFTKIPRKKFRERDKSDMINWNWMLEANKDNINLRRYAYDGLDGLKTGYTKEAGHCFTGTAERDGMRLISVVMGTSSEPARFLETAKVLDYGFTNFELKQVLNPKEEVESLKEIPIKKGVKTTVPVVTESAVSIVAKKGAADEEFVITAEPLKEDQQITAPITAGQVLGTVTVTYGDLKQTANLIATEDVEKGSWIRLFFRAIKNFFVNMVTGGE